MLSNNYFKPDTAKTNTRNALHGCHGVYVKKWVDYSSKYGLGYLLSNGYTGIYFNDSTKMVLDETGQYFFCDLEKLIMWEMRMKMARDC